MKHNPSLPDTWTSNPQVTDDAREATMYKWTNSIYRLHSQSRGRVRKSLAWDIYYIETYSGFAEPLANEDGGWGLHYWLDRQEDGFVIVPLVKSDAALHPFFANMLTRPTYQERPPASTCHLIASAPFGGP